VPKGRIIKDALSLYEMGRNLEINGNYPAAILKYQDSLAVSPRPKTYLALAELETDLHRFAEARVDLGKALELAPGDPAARKAMERLTAIEDLVKKGEEVPKSILERTAPPPLSPAERGKAKAGAEEGSRAVAAPPAVVSEETSHAGLVMPDSGEPSVGKSRLPDITSQEAEPKTETLTEAEEAKVQEILSKSVELISAENYAQAEEELRSGLLEFPDEGRLHYHLGYACQMQKKPRTAVEAYDDAVRVGYRTASVYYNTGLCYEELGGSDLAIKGYQKALQIGGIPAAHFTLGMLYEKRGEQNEALKEFEAYLSSDPKGEYAEEASVHLDRLKRRR
jgi:tetratricopeptide (TPR) repeat protein